MSQGLLEMWFLRLRYSLRSLVRDPVFVSVVILVLSLGIAANTTIFAVVDQLVFHPLSYRDPDRLVMIWETNPSLGDPQGSRVPAAWNNMVEWRRQSQAFEAIEAFDEAGYNVTGLAKPEHLTAAHATGGFFKMLGIEAKQGRTISQDDTRPGADAVVVLTDTFASNHFAYQNPLGQKLLLDGVPHTIVGILPWGFHLSLVFQGSDELKPDIWVPLPDVTAASPRGMAKARRLIVYGRLKRGATIPRAQEEMKALAHRLAQADPELNAGYGVNIVPLKIENADPDLERALYVLWVAAFVVLLLGCLNLASLMTVRAMKRQKDLAIMGALGCPRGVLIANILTESVILAVLAATLAVFGSWAGICIIRALRPGDIFGTERVTMNVPSLLFAGIAFGVSVLLFGLLPAWLSARRAFTDSLKRLSRTASGRAGTILRRILVTAEVAIALVLAIGAVLLVRSFQKILAVDPGFRAHNVLTARIVLAPPRYAKKEDRRQFCDRLLNRIRQLPGVQTASLVDNFPLYSIRYVTFEIEGKADADRAHPLAADYANATSEFFQSMGTPLRSGRLFTPNDTHDTPGTVVILNETMARKFWPNENPLGTHIRLTGGRDPEPWKQVIGIAGDFRQHNIDTPARPEMFWPSREFTEMTLVVRATSDPNNLVPTLEKAVDEIDKEQPLSDVQTLEHMVDHSIAERHFDMLLLSGFACLSILLALVGVYGLISYVLASRTRDIGIRMILGAQPHHILSALLREILPYAVLGVLGGLAVSLFTNKLVASLLFAISPLDPLTYFISPTVILFLTVANCILPTSRATRVDPVNVLRQE